MSQHTERQMHVVKVPGCFAAAALTLQYVSRRAAAALLTHNPLLEIGHMVGLLRAGWVTQSCLSDQSLLFPLNVTLQTGTERGGSKVSDVRK